MRIFRDFVESLLRCREEIQRHEHELKMQSSLQPSAQQKTLNDEIDALSEQLDFIDRSQRDQQLIFDAEVKELKKTLALTEEELEIATSAVTRVKENIKAVRKVKELEMHGTASINDIEDLAYQLKPFVCHSVPRFAWTRGQHDTRTHFNRVTMVNLRVGEAYFKIRFVCIVDESLCCRQRETLQEATTEAGSNTYIMVFFIQK